MPTQLFARRDVLQQVVTDLDERRDGVLPMDLPGVREIYRDEDGLLDLLQLRWYAALVSAIEESLARRPDDTTTAVVRGWQRAADEHPGLRLALDHALDADPEALRRAIAKEHQMLAVTAGAAPATAGLDPELVELGRALEQAARTERLERRRGRRHRLHVLPGYQGIVSRLRAVVAA